MLREKLGRGSITYILKMRTDSAEAAYHINTHALQSYLEQLQQVKGLDELVRIDLASLVQLPGVCQEPRDESDEIERHGPTIRELTAKAIEKLNVMRSREGEVAVQRTDEARDVIATNLSEIAELRPDGRRGVSQAADAARERADGARPSCR